ncbi:MAG: hypothetical protein ACHQYP_00845 [Nitrospiria bacterium]
MALFTSLLIFIPAIAAHELSRPPIPPESVTAAYRKSMRLAAQDSGIPGQGGGADIS